MATVTWASTIQQQSHLRQTNVGDYWAVLPHLHLSLSTNTINAITMIPQVSDAVIVSVLPAGFILFVIVSIVCCFGCRTDEPDNSQLPAPIELAENESQVEEEARSPP
jgi:hypothetical protein